MLDLPKGTSTLNATANAARAITVFLEAKTVLGVMDSLNLGSIAPVILPSSDRRALVVQANELGTDVARDALTQLWQMDVDNVLRRLIKNCQARGIVHGSPCAQLGVEFIAVDATDAYAAESVRVSLRVT